MLEYTANNTLLLVWTPMLRFISNNLYESCICIFILNNTLFHWCFVKAKTMWYGWPTINTLFTCACIVTIGINRSCLWTVYTVWVEGACSIQTKLACSIQSKFEAPCLKLKTILCCNSIFCIKLSLSHAPYPYPVFKIFMYHFVVVIWKVRHVTLLWDYCTLNYSFCIF